MIGRFLGGILLVAGTTIGTGMLALPVMTARCGFYPALLLFFLIWLLMFASAFFFLDVNLSTKGEPNLISMAGKTLGTWGKAVAWIFFLLLLYSLTAAYISASSSLFASAITYLTGYVLPPWLEPFSLPLLFGGFIYLGTGGVDYINRLLMIGLILAYILLISFVPSHIQPSFLTHVDWSFSAVAVPVIITSFGYHIIIPSLTTYMHHNATQLRWTIFIGSALPFVVYVLWNLLVIGAVPLNLLEQALQNGESATHPLAQVLQSPWLAVAARFFSFFAIVTSFLGVALSLSDFLTDGFKIKKTWEGRLMACGLTFLPPLVFVFTYQKGFYLALQYAGAFVAILLCFLPAAMAWTLPAYRPLWRRALLLLVVLCSLGIVFIDLWNS